MRTGLEPINEHINALNRAYAHLDNALDRCETESDYTALLDRMESQIGEPYMDILYQYAWEVMQARLKK